MCVQVITMSDVLNKHKERELDAGDATTQDHSR